MISQVPATLSRRQALLRARRAGASLTALGLLAACGGANHTISASVSSALPTTSSSAAALAPISTTTSSQASATTAAAGVVKPATTSLDVWIWWTDPLQVTTQLADNFSAQKPGIAAKVTVPPDYWTKVQATIAGGVGPDVYLMNNVNYWFFSNEGLLIDLTATVAKDAQAQDYLKNAWVGGIKFYQYKGKLSGLPFMFNAVVTIYNESAIKEAGLTPPAQLGVQWTWETVLTYAEKLTKKSAAGPPVYGAYMSDGIENGWLSFVRANGGDFLNADATTCVIDQPASVAAWQFLTDLLLKYQVSPTADALKKQSATQLFNAGRLIMYDTTTGGLRMIQDSAGSAWPNFNYAIVPYSPTTQRSGGNTNIIGWVLNKAGKSPEPSWSLLNWMLTKPSQDLVARANIDMPARLDSAQLFYDPIAMGGPPNRKALGDMAQWTTPLPTSAISSWNDMLVPVGKWQPQIFAGQVTVADGLKQMASQVNGIFKAAGK